MAAVLFVAYHFAPENTSGTHRSLHFARALVDAGHDVSVITAPVPPESRSDPELERIFPWPERVHRVLPAASIGSLYVGLKRRRRTSSSQNGTGSHDSVADSAPTGPQRGLAAAIARLRYHVSVWDVLPDHQRPWCRPAVKAGRALGRKLGADVVIASGPPWTGVMVGHQIGRALGIPFIADFRDPWSAGSGATWFAATDWAQRRVERWERTVLAESTVVCFNSPRLASVAGDLSSLGDRTRVILNGSDVPRQATSTVVPKSPPLRLRHFGSLYAGRTVTSLVQALDELIVAGAIGRDDVELELIGDIEPAARTPELMNALVRVRFTPHLKFSEAARMMAEPCVLVCVQTEQHANLIPTKLFDYLCTGNPLLVVSPQASASWDIAGPFSRSHRIDVVTTEQNGVVLRRLIDTWRRGELRQEASVQDTEHLGKRPIGAEFVRLVEQVVESSRGINAGQQRGA